MKEASPVRCSCQKWIIRPPDLVPVERKYRGVRRKLTPPQENKEIKFMESYKR